MGYTTLVDPKAKATITWCEIRGVPRGVIHGQYDSDWERRLGTYDYRDRPVDAKMQRHWFKRTNDAVFEGAPLIAVAGTNQSLIEQIAFFCFLTAYYQSHPNDKMPYWHAVSGARGDDLRDDRLKRELMAPINFLVLSNISQGASFAKTEKVRDLLSMYDFLPRLLVLGTADPAAYFVEHLHMTPTRLIYVDGQS